MYRALYEYTSEMKGYLSFQTGDQFTQLNIAPGGDWYHAQNGFGEIGYIPANYVVKDEVGESEVLKSIDRAIEVIHYQASSSGGQYSHTQRENLNKLIQHRKKMIESYKNPGASSATAASEAHTSDMNTTEQQTTAKGSKQRSRSIKRVAPAPPSRITSLAENSCTQGEQPSVNHVPNNEVEQFPNQGEPLNVHVYHVISTEGRQLNMNGIPVNNSENQTINIDTLDCATSEKQTVHVNTVDCATSPFPSPFKSSASKTEPSHGDQLNVIDSRTIPIASNLGSEMIEKVRRNTGLSYKNSCIAVETVLGHLGLRVPEIAEVLDKVYNTIHETDSKVLEEEMSSDYKRLCDLFTELTACKDDSQQRGWALHEDESVISSNLEELVSILENAKQSVSRKAVARESYECVYNLVEYYQMETRVKLRLLLLRMFGAMCSLDSQVISLLLFSILCTELAEELQRNIDDVQRISYVALVLTMLFATGESVPANLHDHLNAEFIHFVFETIENPPSLEHEDEITELLVNLILAFNLHFLSPRDNLVMSVISEKRTVKVFTEKVLLLFNRDENPVHMFDHEPQPASAVLKLLQDMYSSTSTAGVLYTNDARVLIDILLRHLIDLPAGDKVRSVHLKLMQLYLQNSDYVEHRHRFQELSECLHRIQVEEDDTGDDKHIVTYIFKQVPIFSEP